MFYLVYVLCALDWQRDLGLGWDWLVVVVDAFKAIEISCFNKVCAMLVINSLPIDDVYVYCIAIAALFKLYCFVYIYLSVQ